MVTFSPELYQGYFTYSVGSPLPVKWGLTNRITEEINYGGIENIFIENGLSTSPSVLSFTGCTNCWAKNVTIRNVQNYGISIGDSCKVEITGCYVDHTKGNWTTPNHAGINIGGCSALLIENNVLHRCFPCFEVQGGYFSGSVVAFNFLYDAGSWQGSGSPFAVLNASHGAGTYGNLYEGNISTQMVFDGYFGGSDAETIFRNNFHGTGPESTDAGFFFIASRFSRDLEFVGNVTGDTRWTGVFDGIALGNASSFGAGNYGEANNLAGDPQIDLLLTGTVTRTNDSLATVTLPTLGHMDLLQWPITMTWEAQTVMGSPVAAGRRNWLHVLGLDTDNTIVTVGDSSGNNQTTLIPPTGTVVRLWTGPNGYREFDLAVAATTLRLGNNYVFHGGIPTNEALGATTLPDSLFRSSAPPYWAGKAWPPFVPTATTPNRSFTAIPAGDRWVSNNPPRVMSAYVIPSGNRVKMTMNSATVVGGGGGNGMAFVSNPSGGAVTLTYSAAESTSLEKAYITSRPIADNETLPPLNFTQPGDGLQDSNGNDVWDTWEIAVNSLSDVTANGEWISSVSVADAVLNINYGGYQSYRSKVTFPTSRIVNRFRIYSTGHTFAATEQISVFNSSGVRMCGGTASASASNTPHYLYGTLPETFLPAGDYWLSISHSSNGGADELQMPYKAGSGVGIGWFSENSPLWPGSLNGNLNLEATPTFQNGGFAFAIRAIDDGTVVLTPQFNPSPGPYGVAQSVEITTGTPEPVSIYYTTDGTTPTTASTLYTGPVLILATTTLKAIAVKTGMVNSGVQSGVYTLALVPAAPSGLNATAVSTTQINLTWVDNSGNETGFRVERRIGSGAWSTVTTTAANATSYSNTGLTPNTTYEYRVYAVNGAGDSVTPSNSDSDTTFSDNTPTVPTMRSARAPRYAIPRT